jgi:hypothetical protein
LWGARRDPAVLDPAASEQLAQRGVVDVGPRIVGLQALGDDVVAREEPQRSLNEPGDGRGLFVAVDLGEHEAAVVIDHRVTELISRPVALLRTRLEPVAGDLVARLREPGQALGVHLQQITRARPFEPADLLAGRRRHP